MKIRNHFQHLKVEQMQSSVHFIENIAVKAANFWSQFLCADYRSPKIKSKTSSFLAFTWAMTDGRSVHSCGITSSHPLTPPQSLSLACHHKYKLLQLKDKLYWIPGAWLKMRLHGLETYRGTTIWWCQAPTTIEGPGWVWLFIKKLCGRLSLPSHV